jgi:hypothetical protein
VLDIVGRVKVVKVVKAHFPKEKGYMYGAGERWGKFGRGTFTTFTLPLISRG